MAKKAKSEAEEAKEIKKPDFERALRVMTGDLKPLEEDGAKVRGDQSAAWKVIEKDCHLNKKAAKDFFRLRGMSVELRDDYLRTLYGLMRTADIGISEDLVALMEEEGEDREMPVTKRSSPLPTMVN